MSERPDTNEPASPEKGAQPDRRTLIAGIAALVAGALAKAPERLAEAASGDPLVLGQVNEATDPTQIVLGFQPPPSVAFQVVAPAGGGGIGAATLQGPGVFAASGPQSMALAISATSTSFPAFVGVADPDRVTVLVVDANLGPRLGDLSLAPARIVGAGLDTGIIALGGAAASAMNVTLTATSGEGLFALGDASGARIGALDPSGVGLTAFSAVPGGLAFEVFGRTRLGSSGNGTIQPGQVVVTVTDQHVNPTSLVLVTLITEPSRGVFVSYIQAGDGLFLMNLTRESKVPVSFKYVVLDC